MRQIIGWVMISSFFGVLFYWSCSQIGPLASFGAFMMCGAVVLWVCAGVSLIVSNKEGIADAFGP